MKKFRRFLIVVILLLIVGVVVGYKLTKTSNKPEADMSTVSFDDQYFQYDGEEKTMTISGTLPEGVTVTYENNVQKEKGTYEVTATFSTSKYKKIEPMKAKMSIIDVNIGTYPQSVVEDTALANQIIEYGSFSKETGRTTYNGKEYEIMKCYNTNAKDSDLVLKNGSVMKYEQTYVFEIEPIKWKILDRTEEGNFILLAEDILDLGSFFYENYAEYSKYGYEYTADKYDDFYYDGRLQKRSLDAYTSEQYVKKNKSMVGKTSRYGYALAELCDDGTGYPVVSNNYEHSFIREWLNGEFYNTAFNSSEKAKIVKTKVDNSAKSTFEYFPETYYYNDKYCFSYNGWVEEEVYNIWDREKTQGSAWNCYLSNDTMDYVYLPSANDLTNINYGFNGVVEVKDDLKTEEIEATSIDVIDETRKCDVSDYASCRGAREYYDMIDVWTWNYMTRTPMYNKFDGSTSKTKLRAEITTTDIYKVTGSTGSMTVVDQEDVTGVRPMITVKFDI